MVMMATIATKKVKNFFIGIKFKVNNNVNVNSILKLSVQKIFVFYPILPFMNIAKIGIFLKVSPKFFKKFQLFFAICNS